MPLDNVNNSSFPSMVISIKFTDFLKDLFAVFIVCQTQFFIGLRAITYQYYNYRWIYEGYYDNGYYEKEKQYDSFPIIIFGINFGF